MKALFYIRSMVMLMAATLVLLVAPATSAIDQHSCCPDFDAAFAMDADAHAGPMHSMDDDMTSEYPCDASCCINISQIDGLNLLSNGVATGTVKTVNYHQNYDFGAAADLSGQSPPPKRS